MSVSVTVSVSVTGGSVIVSVCPGSVIVSVWPCAVMVSVSPGSVIVSVGPGSVMVCVVQSVGTGTPDEQSPVGSMMSTVMVTVGLSERSV